MSGTEAAAAALAGPGAVDTADPAGQGPLAIDEQPLPVPAGAAAVDLADAFGKLLFRSAFAQRKRAEEAKEAEGGLRDLLLGLLEVDDALSAISAPEGPPAPYAELLPAAAAGAQAGVAATRRLLRLKLARAGVRPMSFDNRLANTAVAEIVATAPVAGVPEDTVVEVVQAGFFWQDQVLRRARVVVSVVPDGPVDGPVAGEELRAEASRPEEPVAEEPVPGEPLPGEPLPGEPLPGEPRPGDRLPAVPVPEGRAAPPDRARRGRKQPRKQQSRAKRRGNANNTGTGTGTDTGTGTGTTDSESDG